MFVFTDISTQCQSFNLLVTCQLYFCIVGQTCDVQSRTVALFMYILLFVLVCLSYMATTDVYISCLSDRTCLDQNQMLPVYREGLSALCKRCYIFCVKSYLATEKLVHAI